MGKREEPAILCMLTLHQHLQWNVTCISSINALHIHFRKQTLQINEQNRNAATFGHSHPAYEFVFRVKAHTKSYTLVAVWRKLMVVEKLSVADTSFPSHTSQKLLPQNISKRSGGVLCVQSRSIIIR